MYKICAWCKKSLSADTEIEGDGISHGICPDCKLALLKAEFPTHLDTFLESMDVPVVLMDGGRHILYANEHALKLSSKNRGNYRGELGGDFIQCKHAESENGCGETEHCGACVIKSSVEITYKTGRDVIDARGFQEIRTQRGVERIYISITTIKKGDLVVLTIKDAEPPIVSG
ncbi:MAG: hypothetical protein C0608_04755 [Deltaproteobacteria bacterium]|nr:MAG: hypothetical protein C0608_04755 [Deltaproteobacteria bacterium]